MAISVSKTPEGVQALRTLGDNLLQELENINRAHDALQQTFEGLKNDIAHEDKIDSILEDILTIQSNVVTSVADLRKKLFDLAAALENFINGGSGN